MAPFKNISKMDSKLNTDALAREGSFNQFHGPEPEKGHLISFNREHEKRWASIDSCRLSKTTMPCRDERMTRKR